MNNREFLIKINNARMDRDWAGLCQSVVDEFGGTEAAVSIIESSFAELNERREREKDWRIAYLEYESVREAEKLERAKNLIGFYEARGRKNGEKLNADLRRRDEQIAKLSKDNMALRQKLRDTQNKLDHFRAELERYQEMQREVEEEIRDKYGD